MYEYVTDKEFISKMKKLCGDIMQALFQNDSKAKEIIEDPNKWESLKKEDVCIFRKSFWYSCDRFCC